VTGFELVGLPAGLEELPPKTPELVEPLLPVFDEADGLLPPNIEPPAPVALLPPVAELGGLLLVLGLLPPNMEPPLDGLLEPPLGRLELGLELRPFWAYAEVETRKARANAPISPFDLRMSTVSEDIECRVGIAGGDRTKRPDPVDSTPGPEYAGRTRHEVSHHDFPAAILGSPGRILQ